MKISKAKAWLIFPIFALGIVVVSVFTLKQVLAAGPYTCTWTGNSSDNFNVAGNWSGCNNSYPQAGDNDNLIFDESSLGSDATLVNNITGLNLTSILFQGTGNYGFAITGNAISISGGITDNAFSADGDGIETNLTLTANQSITDLNGTEFFDIGDTTYAQTLNLGSHTLTLNSALDTGGIVNINSRLEGTGNIIGNGDTYAAFQFSGAANGYSGQVAINDGSAYLFTYTALGTGMVTVGNGAGLFGQAVSSTPTFSNPITVGGTGQDGFGALAFYDGCPAPGGSGQCSSTGTITLSGPINLTGPTTIQTATTLNADGVVGNCYALTLAESAIGTLNVNSTPSSCVYGSGAGSGMVFNSYNDLPVIAVQGNNSSLDYYYQESDGSWGETPLAGSRTTNSAPSLAFNPSNNLPVIAVEGFNNSLDYYYQETNGSWGETTLAGSGSVYSAPSLAFNPSNDLPVITSQASFRGINYFYQQSNASWGLSSLSKLAASYSSPSLYYNPSNDLPVIALQSANNSLSFLYQQSNANWGVTPLSGSGSVFNSPSLYYNPGNDLPVIAVQSVNNSLSFYYQQSGGSWGDSPLSGSNSVFAAPSLFYNPGNDLPVIAVESAGASLSFYYQQSGGSWGDTPLTGYYTTYSAPALAFNPANDLPAIAIQGASGNLQYVWQDGTGNWNGPQGL